MGSFFDYLQLPLSLFGIIAVEAMGLQLILGGAGLLTLGHTAFFAIGGYASAAFVSFLAPHLGIENHFVLLLLGILFAGACTAFFAAIVAIPCLRLKGDYLAVATMGLGQITENTLNNIPQFGGASGFTNIPRLSNLGIIFFLVLCIWVLLRNFYQTYLGHAILCSRDDEVVSRCFEISPERSKFAAFIIGNIITGVAGALYVHTFQFISPVAAGFQKSVEILVAVVIGGMFSISGSVLGAAVLVLVPELIRFIPHGLSTGLGGFLITRLSQNSMLLFSLIVLVILKTNSSGIMHAVLVWSKKGKSEALSGN